MKMDKSTILFIMHMPPPMHGAAQVGQYIYDSKLINESFNCRYINPSASESVQEVGKLSFRKIKFLISFLKQVSKEIDGYHPNLIYITPSSWDWGFYRDYILVMLLKKKGCKIIAHFHNKGVKKFEEKWYNKMLYRSFFKDIFVIFLSNKLVPEFRPYLSDKQIFVCQNGVKTNAVEFKGYGKEKKPPFKFLFLSNMMEEKGVYILLEACKILKEKKYIFNCTFVGNWSDITESSFKKKVTEYNLENNVFAVGAKYGKEKNEFFENSQCFVFPTYYHGECFPLVLLEAMHYGLPCISTAEGGILDIIDDGRNGFIVKQKDPSSLAQKMEYLLNHISLVEIMSTNARVKFEEEYSYEIFERKIYGILSKCLNYG